MDKPVIFVAVSENFELAHKVAEEAISIAKEKNARVVFGHVIDSTALETAGGVPDDYIMTAKKDFADNMNDVFTKAKTELGDDNVEVEIQYGRLREVLKNNMIIPMQPDLIVCGERGMSQIQYALMGSISTFITRIAPCNVLIVKLL